MSATQKKKQVKEFVKYTTEFPDKVRLLMSTDSDCSLCERSAEWAKSERGREFACLTIDWEQPTCNLSGQTMVLCDKHLIKEYLQKLTVDVLKTLLITWSAPPPQVMDRVMEFKRRICGLLAVELERRMSFKKVKNDKP